jgi:hypothetical protein
MCAARHSVRADWVFRPVYQVHEQQKQSAQAAGEGIIHIKQAIEGLQGAPLPATPTVDELMRKIEETPSAPPSRR